jgi:hypothetical protein
MSRALIAAIALIFAALGGAAWFLWPHHPYQPTTPREKALVSVMVSDLTGLRNAEDDYYKMRSRYTNIADSTIFLRTPGISPPSIRLVESGWYATVTHGQLPGVTCAIAVGTRNPLLRSAAEGEAACR